MFQDLRSAFRQITKSPAFSLVAILTLALGIGANTAIFSVVHAVLLRPLPSPGQEQLVTISEHSEQVPGMSVSYPDFLDWRQRQTSFSSLGIARRQSFTWARPTGPERIAGTLATHDALTTLAIPPLRGRIFTSEDDRQGAARTVLLGEGFWQRAFGGRDSAVGESIELNGESYAIIGVMPESLRVFYAGNDVIIPVGLFADQLLNRLNHMGMYGVARLRPGVTFEQAEEEMDAIAGQLAHEYPNSNAGISVTLTPLTDRIFGPASTALYLLFGAAGVVLLIACANVANLQLARAQTRGREFAIRSALGAGRAQIIRQTLVESALLGLLGSLAGILLAAWGLDLLQSVIATQLPRATEIQLNAPVLGFAVGSGLLASVFFGLAPATQAMKQDLRSAFVASAGTAGVPEGKRWRATLVITEFALTCLLVTGAVLMLRTLGNLQRAQLGYSVEHVTTFDLDLSSPAFRQAEIRRALITRVLERLGSLPSLTAVSAANPLPLRGGNQEGYYIEGTPLPDPGTVPSVERAQVSSEYFDVMRLPLVAGRGFTPQDNETAPRVAIVDTLFVQKNFPGQDPIGKRFTYDDKPPQRESDWRQIVGVVAHIRNFGPRAPTREQTYLPITQSVPTSVSFAVRTSRPSASLVDDIRAVMREAAPAVPIFNIRTMEARLESSVATERLTMTLLGTFAGLALLLAGVGLYGVLNTLVGQRTREIGIRMALGATPAAVVGLLVRHGLKLAAAGLAVGLVAAFAFTRLMRSLLYEVSPFDLLSFTSAAGVLVAIGIVACWLPARRATRVNPVDALHAE